MQPFSVPAQVFLVGLVFARVGAMVMLIPGFGESPAPVRVRLAFALLLALVLTPVVSPTIPPLPTALSDLGLAAIKEVLVGLVIGGILRMFLAALAVAGEIVSIETTLSFAQTANPSFEQGGSTLAAFLTLMGVVLIMSTNLHHLFIGAMARSYNIPVADANTLAMQTFSQAFALGVQLAAPIMVFALVFNIATGLVGRAMPQFQVFFVATPLQLLLGLSLFALSLGVIGMVWLDRYRDLLGRFT
jgi:flagellar biosynthetic protein FliR